MGHLFEILTGTVDGVNDTFTFSAAYTPGTAAIYLNGQLLFHPSGNPWTESDPTTGEITVIAGCEPRVGDVLSGFALDTVAPSAEVVIDQRISGCIEDAVALQGIICDADCLVGCIEDAAITGRLVDQEVIIGELEDDDLTGVSKEC